MKIVAGMGSIDDYTDFAEAGADEIFIGFVPESWQEKYGLSAPLNRREVCYYNVNVGSFSELEILSSLMEKHGLPVTIALNGLNYPPEAYPEISDIIASCQRLNFTSFIIADLGLLIYLKQTGLSNQIKLHVSGELSEINSYLLDELIKLDINRLIFHRKLSLDNMSSIIEKTGTPLEYEAFLLNENCHFNGAFCNSLHCDELVPMCRMPYKLSNGVTPTSDDYFEGIGSSGCGLCALYKLKTAGVTHLKIVGRGGYSANMIRDIKATKKALKILDRAETEEVYKTKMLQTLFKNDCSNKCYYLDSVNQPD